MRVYIAGPITTEGYSGVRSACEAANRLLDMGHAPYIPHLSMIQNIAFPRPREDWLYLDKQYIEVCGALLRLPGDSEGAEWEESWARELGIPVLAADDPVTWDWFSGRA